MTTSEQRQPVNNGQSEAVTASLRLTYHWSFSDNPLHNNHIFQVPRVAVVHMFDCTVIPELTTTSEQRPPVNNDWLNPISSKLILIFVEHILNISHLGTTATFLESQECLLYTGLTVLWSAEICYLTFETYTLKLLEVQSNLSTTATLGTPKKWPLYKGGRSVKVFQSKLKSE